MLNTLIKGIRTLVGRPPDLLNFKTGQVWAYTTRPGEERSLLCIARTEPGPANAPIFHVCASGLHIRHPGLAGGVMTTLPHAPVSLQSLQASVTRLVCTVRTAPDISQGYAAWKEQFDAGEAGIFTIPFHEIVEVVERSIARHLGAMAA